MIKNITLIKIILTHIDSHRQILLSPVPQFEGYDPLEVIRHIAIIVDSHLAGIDADLMSLDNTNPSYQAVLKLSEKGREFVAIASNAEIWDKVTTLDAANEDLSLGTICQALKYHDMMM